MCGIVAYTGKKDCANIIIDGLKKLEYRGYDSAGIAFEDKDKIKTVKALGKVKNLAELLAKQNSASTCAIGHTRWATHGKPSNDNCHPHSDCSGKISLVHNGIIENYQELKKTLEKKGHKFVSQTDSEVAAHLIEENLKKTKDFFIAFQNAIKQLKGAYAIVAVYAGEPAALFAAKKQSPLVLGLASDGYYLASDVPAFLKHTKKVLFFEDGDIAKITPKGYSIVSAEGKKVERKISNIKWDASTAQKGGFKHFMLKEIFDQPSAIKDTLRTLPPSLEKAFNISAAQAKKVKGVYIIACGTAYHAALAGKYMIEHFAALPVEVETASEFKYRDVAFQKDWLFIAVSQSGETADTLAALKNAKAAKLKTLSICNVLGSTLTRQSSATVYTHCGPEISVASTKAFTSQLSVLYSFALNLAYTRGKLTKQEFAKLYREFETLPKLVEETLKTKNTVKKLAENVYKNPGFLFLGRNASFPVALEGALKLKEISYLHAEGFAGGEIKHGPIAIIDKNTPVIALAPKGRLHDKMLSSCQEVCARGAKLIVITNTAQKNAIVVPYTNEYLFPILAVIPLQFFAYYVSDMLGREIDQPRNLAKSVTVE
ncbi:MAG: glutamine--fructose-6-phosphate transaminase (isomerizing) [Elusimicrobiota bacterium]|jgi:glucosamine--fructose-6-phosphate aminotransferase (isomerizing)|nr:glutamine--fructose-6-phosphate transaminase (isomerizing) [Elusimicrobiota bacterium]